MARTEQEKADAIQDAHDSIEDILDRLTLYGGFSREEGEDLLRAAVDNLFEARAAAIVRTVRHLPKD